MVYYSDYSEVLGNPGDEGVAGDWTGKGYDSAGVYRPTASTFYLSNVNVTSGVIYADLTAIFGNPESSLPIIGDWIGQGHDGIGLFLNGNVYLRYAVSSGAADNTFLYGASGDLPIAGHWLKPVPTATPTLTATASITLTPSNTATNTPCISPTPGPVPNGGVNSAVCKVNFVPTATPTPFQSCPWYGTPSPVSGSPNTCTYHYDRDQALKYALQYAQSANPLFCRYQYYGTSSSCAGSGNTDCADFISQAILDGGLITIKAGKVLLSYDSTQWFINVNSYFDLYENDATADDAWAGADTNQLPQHFRDLGGTEIGVGSKELNVIVDPPPTIYNTVIPPVPTFVPIIATQIQSELNTLATPYDASGPVVAANIEFGDIMFLDHAIDPNGLDDAHTVFVVGWGHLLLHGHNLRVKTVNSRKVN